jgi:hypothetical protein
MKQEIWRGLNEVEENLYEAKALLDVMADGMCNEVILIDNDAYATTTRLICEKIEKAQEANTQLFVECRENDDGRIDYASAWPDDELASEWPDDGAVGVALQDGAGDGDSGQVDEEAERDYFGKSRPRFDVNLKEEHPDGSATYTVSGSKEDMQKLFEAFFNQALSLGIESANTHLGYALAREKVLETAKQLNALLAAWETSDEMDYTPVVKEVRQQLGKYLQGMERCGKPS